MKRKEFMNRLFFISAIILLMAACNTTKTEKLTISSVQPECTVVGPQKCLLVKEEGQTNWTFFYDNIEGFNYEPGYEYVIEIKKEKKAKRPNNASSIRYIFVKEISKIQKSESMPQFPMGNDDNFMPEETDPMLNDTVEVDG